MGNEFNLLRLCCLLQDRDAQDFKRVVLSIIFEILYENNNQELSSDELFSQLNKKFHLNIDLDFFQGLVAGSTSFEVSSLEKSTLIKLTSKKYNDLEKDITEYSIDTHIESFLKRNGYPLDKQEYIITILYNSIYENIFSFSPNGIGGLIRQTDVATNQQDLDLFNKFLEDPDPAKNRCLYNQFAKAIEFAIITSGKGVTHFSENLYKDKTYLLDTNIIFRLMGVGGDERQSTIVALIKSCIKQGIRFEYTNQTLLELRNKLSQCIIDLKRAEKSKKGDIVEEIYRLNPQFFNDDFITHYTKLRIEQRVISPEQYELEMHTSFKDICRDLNISLATNNIQINEGEKNMLSTNLVRKRKELNVSYRYSIKQARVDAYNILFVYKRRGANDYNYSDVKSFYLTTDRGLNRILSSENGVKIPASILPSQLFLIHNPLSYNSSNEPDYDTFFRFLKRRTSEFKLRGRDVSSYITTARKYTTDFSKIVSLIETYSDMRYNVSKTNSLEEGLLLTFDDFAKTQMDKMQERVESIETGYNQMIDNSNVQLNACIRKSKNQARILDCLVALGIVPIISLVLKLIIGLDWWVIVPLIFVSEIFKFYISSRTVWLKNVWKWLFELNVKSTGYFKLTKDYQYIVRGLTEIESSSDNIWK